MRTGRSTLPVVLAVILAIGGSVPALAAGPATPEDAVRDYLAGVAQADVGMIVDASAIDEMSAGFRFDLQTERLKAMSLTGFLAPADYPMFIDMNRAQQSAIVVGQVRSLVYSLLSSEQVDGSIIAPADKARADAFIKQVDPSRLAGLAVADIRFPLPRLEHDPTHLANTAKQAATYGADEITERLALVSFEGKSYGIGFTLLRYGDVWKVSSQVSNLAGTSPLGSALPMSPDEYYRQTLPE
jgi:hypothetical protein